jgi:serine/threonine protein phosphatase PrpC
MSFISKLFRKTEPLEPREDQAPTPGEELNAAVADASVQLEPGEPGEQPGADDQELGANGAAPDQELSPVKSEDESGLAWWEETSEPRAEVTTQPAIQPVSLSEEPSDEPASAVVEPQAPSQEIQTAELDIDETGTRPLRAADVPMLAALRSHRGLAAAALRDIGRIRSINQDSVFAMISTLPRESGDVSMGLFIVADGMGGHHGGEVASRMAISTVVRHVLAELVVPALTDGATEALQALIISALQEANRTIWEHAQVVGSDMGTTCTVALLLGRALYIGHVGDSRAYLVGAGGMHMITSDHSTVGRLIQLGQLDPSEARDHPLRSQLYRTIGQQPEVMVDFIYQPIGDATHLLLGSDGLWGMLEEEVLLDVLENTLWPQDACHELIARANLAGGEDNISAVVVSLPALNGP